MSNSKRAKLQHQNSQKSAQEQYREPFLGYKCQFYQMPRGQEKAAEEDRYRQILDERVMTFWEEQPLREPFKGTARHRHTFSSRHLRRSGRRKKTRGAYIDRFHMSILS